MAGNISGVSSVEELQGQSDEELQRQASKLKDADESGNVQQVEPKLAEALKLLQHIWEKQIVDCKRMLDRVNGLRAALVLRERRDASIKQQQVGRPARHRHTAAAYHGSEMRTGGLHCCGMHAAQLNLLLAGSCM